MPDYCSSCMAPLAQPGQPCPVCGAQGAGEVPAHHLCPGTVLNRRYYVGKALGEGGFGITYIGHATSTPRAFPGACCSTAAGRTSRRP